MFINTDFIFEKKICFFGSQICFFGSLPSGLKPKPFHWLQSRCSEQMLLPCTTFYTAKLGKRSSLSQLSFLREKKKQTKNQLYFRMKYILHKQTMNVKENHIVPQHLEEPQQLQACAPSQHLLPTISGICPTPSHWTLGTLGSSFSNISSSTMTLYNLLYVSQ